MDGSTQKSEREFEKLKVQLSELGFKLVDVLVERPEIDGRLHFLDCFSTERELIIEVGHADLGTACEILRKAMSAVLGERVLSIITGGHGEA